MSNVSMINGHIDEPKGLTTGKAVSMIDEYLEEPNSINKEWVECMRLCKQALLENVNLKADKEALINGQESLMKHLERKKEIITELDNEVERLQRILGKRCDDCPAVRTAINEFAEKVLQLFPFDKKYTTISRFAIKNIANEMTEGKSNDKAFWEDTN